VPLNTVYFIATRDTRESMILSAYLNSLPLRVFARAIAERAKDAHFRFFAWTIAVLPLPADWRDGAVAARLCEIAAAAHEAGALPAGARAELDALVADAFAIDDAGRASLAAFDAWLAGARADDGVRGTAAGGADAAPGFGGAGGFRGAGASSAASPGSAASAASAGAGGSAGSAAPGASAALESQRYEENDE
jgi:hypothetical protein